MRIGDADHATQRPEHGIGALNIALDSVQRRIAKVFGDEGYSDKKVVSALNDGRFAQVFTRLTNHPQDLSPTVKATIASAGMALLLQPTTRSASVRLASHSVTASRTSASFTVHL